MGSLQYFPLENFVWWYEPHHEKGTVNFLNIRKPQKFVVITLKFELRGSTIEYLSPNDADGMANSVDPDQTAPLGAVWSGSALFAQAYLSENLGSLRYLKIIEW